ncbi:MAG: hypothetical protein ACI9VT_000855, partial [Psychroserpens sp.]
SIVSQSQTGCPVNILKLSGSSPQAWVIHV